MLTTVKSMTKRKRETAHQNLERKLREIQEKNLEKSSYFIKRKKTLTQHQHGRFIQNFEILKQKVKPKLNENKKIINTSQISPDTHHSNPKSCLIRRQQAVHSGQLSLQLKNLTVQAADLREDCVLLVPILQHDVVALQVPHIGLQLLDAGLKVHLSVLQPHLLQQRLLVF